MSTNEAASAAAKETPSTPAPQSSGRTVPYDRFEQVIRERDEARSKLQEVEPTLAEVGSLRAKLSTVESDLQLADMGISDPEGRDIARYLHGRLGEDAPALGEWVAAQKADPGSAHPSVRPFLPSTPVATVPGAAEPAETSPPPAVPTPNAGTRPAPASADVDSNALRQARERYQRTGSDADLKKMQELTRLARDQIRG